MKIHYLLKHDIEPALHDEIEALFNALFECVKIPRAILSDLAFASEDRFSEAIGRFLDKTEYTKSDGLLAVGKCIRTGGGTTSAIVLRDICLNVVNEYRRNGSRLSDWTVRGQELFYIIVHEAGHALDHSLRPEPTEKEAEETHKLGALSRYYANIALTEYYASRFSKNAYIESLFEDEMAMNNSAVCQSLERTISLFNGDFFKARLSVIHTAGFMLTQHSKYIGNGVRPSLDDWSIGRLWEIANISPQIGEALEEFERVVSSWSERHPNWDYGAVGNEIQGIIRKIAKGFGYRIEDATQEDCIFVCLLHPPQDILAGLLLIRTSGLDENLDSLSSR